MSRSRRGQAWFLLTQAGFLCALCSVAALGVRHSRTVRTLPEFSDRPLVIRPLYDDPRVVTDQQLRLVLQKLLPPSTTDFPRVNHIDHALRFWGVEAEFVEPDRPDGAWMREFLVNDRFFRTQSHGQALPLLQPRDSGVAFRTQEGRDTSSHTDHTLATLAEVGTPLSFPLQTPAGPRPLRQALSYALRHFALDQPEYEWSALTFALYGVDDSRWYTADGRRMSWNRIAERLMRQRLGQGCCYGGHRLFTLTALLRIDQQRPLFSEAVRRGIQDHLWEATCRLVRNQNGRGAMDGSWPGAPIMKNDRLSPLGQQLLATGHALEWWAIAPEELQPPRETVVRAGQWMTTTVLQLSDQAVRENYTFLTHAGRALAMWRGAFPAEFLARERDTP